MIKIDTAVVARVLAANDPSELHDVVGQAIALEHATIPPYLTAWLTVPPATNRDVRSILEGIFLDEMLHMGLMANLLIAIGGTPRFAAADFVPRYPGPLPLGIGDGLQVTLRKCSIEQIETVFMEIEEPENPIVIETLAFAFDSTEFHTIGQFYAALAAKLTEFGERAFADPHVERQVSSDDFDAPLRPIATLRDALDAIETITRQGEGTAESPFSEGATAAHYYRFQQIVRGGTLSEIDGVPHFGDPPIAFDPAAVIDMEEGIGPDSYPEGSAARAAVHDFMVSYSDMLRGLERAFGGAPDALAGAIDVMGDLVRKGRDVLALPSPLNPPKRAGLAFGYLPL